MQQELPQVHNKTVQEFLFSEISGSPRRFEEELGGLLATQTKLEDELESAVDVEAISLKLCEISEVIESIEVERRSELVKTEWTSDERKILQGLGILGKGKRVGVLEKQMGDLSGGWRIRVTIALALIAAKSADVLLMDEASNHRKFFFCI